MSNIANTDTARASPIQRRQQDNETHLHGSEAKRDDSYRRRKQREAVRASSTEGKVSVDEPLETQCRCTPSHRQIGRTPSVTPTWHCRATDVRASGSDTTCERGRNAADDPRAEGRVIEIQQTDLRCSRHHKARSAGSDRYKSGVHGSSHVPSTSTSSSGERDNSLLGQRVQGMKGSMNERS